MTSPLYDTIGRGYARARVSDPRIEAQILATTIEAVPIPQDCSDGFTGAYWARPEDYLDPNIRAGMSAIRTLDLGYRLLVSR